MSRKTTATRNALALLVLGFLLQSKALPSEGKWVTESRRSIPVIARVDVAVVGGSTGACACACRAAQSGARVFLAAPRPYLGEDMAGLLRLWLSPGEKLKTQLAKKLFSEKWSEPPVPRSGLLRFTYTADRPSQAPHLDTDPPRRLTDGRWGSAVNQSVQYNGKVTLTLDLGALKRIEECHVLAYHARDFQIESLTVAASPDGTNWRPLGTLKNENPPQESVDQHALDLIFHVKKTARALRITVAPARGSNRVLLGEILLAGPQDKSEAPRIPARPLARPLHVKRILEQELLKAGVEFLYGCYAVDVLRDAEERPAGIVLANRAGRQAVIAKVIVDATERAWVARQAGAQSQPFRPGTYKVQRVVIGGNPVRGPDMEVAEIRPPYRKGGRLYRVYRYALSLPFPDGSYRYLAEGDQSARDKTYHPDQQFTSDGLFMVPPDPILCRSVVKKEIEDLESLPLEAFQPRGVPFLFLLNGCASVPRALAKRLLRPPALIALGERIGRSAASLASRRPTPSGVHLGGEVHAACAPGDVRENLSGARPFGRAPSVLQQERSVPVLGTFEVVVIGGGTAGAPAAIAASRSGARTLVVEYLYGLGGVGTQGAISKYYWGNRVGFSAETPFGASWKIEQKAEWYRRTLREAGAEIWFGAIGCGAFVQGRTVKGVVVATPEGRGVVLAEVVIDATGNADIAAAAGAPCVTTGPSDIAVQGTGLPPRRLGAGYTNTDFTIVDESDLLDVWRIHVCAKALAGDSFDIGKLIDTRERRRIDGEVTPTILDAILNRTWPDTIARAYSDFDTHGYTVDPYFTLQHPPHRKGFYVNIPLRALLPRGLEALLVTGIGLSVHRDLLPLVRMQADVQNQGYAAGLAAALAAEQDVGLRELKVRELQKRLVEKGNLPPEVLKQQDSFPLPRERISQAARNVADGYRDCAVLLAHPQEAIPLLREAYKKAASSQAKLIYAHVLAVLGDRTGVETLITAVESFKDWDKGWRYRAMGQYGPNMSPLDRLIYALGRAGDKRAVPAVLKKAALLTPESEFSHFRAVALACEALKDQRAAPVLAKLLQKPEMQGHAIENIKEALDTVRRYHSWTATSPRSLALRELMLARALYRCGDWRGLGRRILEAYTRDLRGHMARHAHSVLNAPER